ncbi:DUF397 domain-containing protein [Marinactinospora rubrisoli]|uniref:DUF397 domain-containing protein n=1 Tax=Marinactinospora rubrisoli TaxID=2715399 RepID=A0ABW2KQC1_9ACTN
MSDNNAAWRKSSYSNANGGDCVEVADLAASIGVRDSKHPEQGHLTFARSEWAAFLRDVKSSHL